MKPKLINAKLTEKELAEKEKDDQYQREHDYIEWKRNANLF